MFELPVFRHFKNFLNRNMFVKGCFNTFGPRSTRHRKKPPAAVANQIAEDQKISLGMQR